MAKEKKSFLDDEKKDLTFYYEIISIVCLLVTVLGFARLGTVGYYITLVFKITFGDWYFLMLIGLAFIGLYGLIYHKPLKIKNMRSIGIIFILMGILMVTHFPMHNYIATVGTSYLSLTTNLYLDYFKNYQEGMILGGGLVGSILFYIAFTLFSSAGTFVVIFILLFVGVSFTCKKTVAEFTTIIFGFSKGFFKRGRKLFKSLKYDIVREPKEKTTRTGNESSGKTTKITTDLLDAPLKPLYLASEEKHAEGVLKSVNSVLDLMLVTKRNVTYLISCHVTTFTIKTTQKIDETAFNTRLASVLNDDFLIKRELEDTLVVEVNNLYENKINLKNVIGQSPSFFNSLSLFVGEVTDKKVLEIDLKETGNLLIIGDGLKSDLIIQNLIVQLFLKNKKNNININYFHLISSIDVFDNLPFVKDQFDHQCDQFKGEIDERLNLLNTSTCNSLSEYNQKNNQQLKYQVIIINGFEKLLGDSLMVENVHYLLQLGPKAGYFFIFKLNECLKIPSVILGLLANRLFLRNNFALTKQNLGVDTLLLAEIEGIYLYRNILKRFTIASVSTNELDKFKMAFSKK